MIITAMYIYGMSQHAWGFSWLNCTLTFLMDAILIALLRPHIKVISKSSDEERAYWKKRCEVEELNRVKLDKELYGGKH